MQIFLRLALLATMLAVVFINPAYIGRSCYNLLLFLLLLLGVLFWYSSQRITSRMQRKLIAEEILLVRSGIYKGPEDLKGRWVTLLLSDHTLYVLERGAREVEILLAVARSEVAVQREAGRKKVLRLQIEDAEYSFRSMRPKALVSALEG